MPSFAVILPAAGRSSRFGGDEKKPFLTLDGAAVWRRSADLFLHRPDVRKVCVVVSPEDRDYFDREFGDLCAGSDIAIVTGGAERFESVANALAHVPDGIDFVAIHDAVRPLVGPSAVDAVFSAAIAHGAAMLAVPVADTLKRVESPSNRIAETVPRDGLWAAQTPQVFRHDWLVEAYARRAEAGAAITDDAQLVEALGHSVFVVPGSPANFKITTPDDFGIAEAILESRRRGRGPAVGPA